jgi:hypothetical protein
MFRIVVFNQNTCHQLPFCKSGGFMIMNEVQNPSSVLLMKLSAKNLRLRKASKTFFAMFLKN